MGSAGETFRMEKVPLLSEDFLVSFDKMMLSTPFGTFFKMDEMIGSDRRYLRFMEDSRTVHKNSRAHLAVAWKEHLKKPRRVPRRGVNEDSDDGTGSERAICPPSKFLLATAMYVESSDQQAQVEGQDGQARVEGQDEQAQDGS